MRTLPLTRLTALLTVLVAAGCDDVPGLGAASAWLAPDDTAAPSERAQEAAPLPRQATASSPTRVVPFAPVVVDESVVVGTPAASTAPLGEVLGRLHQLASVGEIRALPAWLSHRTLDRLSPHSRAIVPIAPRTLWRMVDGDVVAVRYDGGRALVHLRRDRRDWQLTFYLEDAAWRLDLLAHRELDRHDPKHQQARVLPTLQQATAGVRGTGPLVAFFDTSTGSFRCELREAKVPSSVAAFVALAHGKVESLRREGLGPPLWVAQRAYDGGVVHAAEPDVGIVVRPRAGEVGTGLRVRDELELDARFDREGLLALDNDGPDSADGRLVVTLRPRPDFIDRLTWIGVCRDLDVVRKIAKQQPGSVRVERVDVRRGW